MTALVESANGVVRAEMLTRQDIADFLGWSYEAVRRNEKRLGLEDCRIVVNRRVIYYREDLVVLALIKVGFLVRPKRIFVNNSTQVATTLAK